MIEIVPPRPEAGICVLDAFTAATAVSCTGTLVSGAVEAMLNVAVATGPLVMRLLFTPYTMHTMDPTPLEHDMLLPADVALDDAVTLTPETSEEGYVRVHCKMTGCAPPEVANDTFKLALPPRTALPEPNDSVTWAAKGDAVATKKKTKGKLENKRHRRRKVAIVLKAIVLALSWETNQS